MDIGTIIGIVVANIFVFAAIVMGGGSGFINIPAIMITVGGSLAATLINFPLPKILGTMGVVRKAFSESGYDYAMLYKTISDFAVRARRDGMLALEDEIEGLDDAFMKKGFQMAVDGSPAEMIKGLLEEDIGAMLERHQVGHSIFKALGNYAPAFGMIGTLIGLIQMLRELDDPSSIGKGMAVALLTTLYGSLVANMVALPIAGKLEQRTNEEVSVKNMILTGILAVQEGNSPRVVQDKVVCFIPPKLREGLSGGQ